MFLQPGTNSLRPSTGIVGCHCFSVLSHTFLCETTTRINIVCSEKKMFLRLESIWKIKSSLRDILQCHSHSGFMPVCLFHPSLPTYYATPVSPISPVSLVSSVTAPNQFDFRSTKNLSFNQSIKRWRGSCCLRIEQLQFMKDTEMIFSVSARQTVRLQEVDGCTHYLPGQYQVVKQSNKSYTQST